MSEKPKVIPTKEQIETANATSDARLAEETVNGAFTAPKEELEFATQMEEEAKRQVEAVKRGEQVIRHDLAESEDTQTNVAVGANYQSPPIERVEAKPKPITPKVEIPTNMEYKTPQKPINVPYDVIPLPSEGKVYPHKKGSLKVAYLNAHDENILTSPNILENGEFLNILLNEKILEDGIKLEDLIVGDRNAIMIWLRATGYGEMYPIVVYDNDGNPFETEVDLSTLPYKKLPIEADSEGLFTYTLPRSKKVVKFKLLNIGEMEEIETKVLAEIDNPELEYSNGVTYRLEKMIVEVDGIRDKKAISNYIPVMPIADSRALRNYYDEIEPNVDLEIKVEAPGGSLIETFLPINPNFFWPDFEL